MDNKINIKDISSDNDSDNDGDNDGDKTPTKEKYSDNDVTPNETLNDITDMKDTLKKVEDVLSGKEINKQDLDNIKEDYNSFFDEDSGNETEEEGLKQLKEYIDDELEKAINSASLAGLDKELEKLTVRSDTKSYEEEPMVSPSKRVKTNEGSTSTIDFVLEKQSIEPIEPDDPD
jgi:hypothetical protein